MSSFSAQALTLTKNPNYWQPGKPAVTRIVFPVETDSNTGPALALSQGQAQWGGIFDPAVKAYASKPGNHYWFPPMSDAVLILNMAKAPMNSLAFRQAVDMTLNRQAVENSADLNLVSPVTNPTMLTPYQSAFLAPKYAHAQAHHESRRRPGSDTQESRVHLQR